MIALRVPLVIVAAIGGITLSTHALARSWHVSPAGTGSACTPSRPCALMTAVAEVRIAAPEMREDFEIILAGGRYFLSQTWELHAADSGQNGHRIIYRAAPGTQPELTGARRLTNWKLADRHHSIWRADVGNLRTRQLYAGKERLPRAARLSPFGDGAVLDADGVMLAEPQGAAWQGDMEAVWQGESGGVYSFVESRCPVAALMGGRQARIAQPCLRNAMDLYDSNPLVGLHRMKPPSWVENSPTFLTDPGQQDRWAIIREKGASTVYLRTGPRRHPRDLAIEAPALERLLLIDGATHITFSGITFSGSTWLDPDAPAGFPNVFAGAYVGAHQEPREIMAGDVWNPPASMFIPGAIEVRNARHIAFDSAQFERLGSYAISASRDVASLRISNSRFYDVSAGAISLGSDAAGRVQDILIENNEIEDVALEFGSAPAIMATLTADTFIAHNRIANTGYSGIVMYGSHGWGDTRGNVVLANLVSDSLWRTTDGGGIYSVFSQGPSQDEGLLIEGNVVITPHNPDHGINMGLYTDMGSRHVTVRRNITWGFRISTPECALMATHSVVKERNFLSKAPWAPCRTASASRLEPGLNSIVRDNTLIGEDDPEANCRTHVACMEILQDAGLSDRAGQLNSRVDGFEAIRSFLTPQRIEDIPMEGARWGVSYPRGEWLLGESRDGHVSSMFLRPVSHSAAFRLEEGAILSFITLEGSGEVSIADGSNARITRELPGPGRLLRVYTGWRKPGGSVTLSSSSGSFLVDSIETSWSDAI